MNILIKLTCLIGLVVASILGDTYNYKHEDLDVLKQSNLIFQLKD